MSETPSDPKPKPSKDEAWDAVGENDLDEALSKAAELASDLSRELAAPDESARPASQDPMASDRDALDRELSHLGDLVSATAQEVDAPPSKPAPVADDVPDFMAEFMSPAQTPSAPSAAAPTGAESSPFDAAEPAEEMDDLAATPSSPAPPARSRMSAASPSNATSSPAAAPKSGPQVGIVGAPINIALPPSLVPRAQVPQPAPPPALSELDEPHASSLGLFAVPVALLELLNLPFAWAGAGVRKAAGWLGLIVLAAAIALVALAR